MYHTVDIQTLSPKQISRILNGHAVRVKMGSGAKMHVSAEHAKKLHRAKMKGGAATITLDPYAIEHNQHLRTRKARGGTALIDQPFTVREAVDVSGKFIKDPAKTLGFGARKGLPAKYKGSGPKGLKKFQKWTGAIGNVIGDVGDFIKPVAKPIFEAGTRQAVNLIDAYGNAQADKVDPYGALMGRGKRGGTALIDQPFTVRQAVDTSGRFIKDPAKTLGFGAKRKGKGFVQDIAKLGNKMLPVLQAMKPQYNDLGVGDKVAKSLGLGVKKDRPKRVMSDAQRAALAKGRAALRIKLNEMGAGSGGAARPAGYGMDKC